MNTQIGLFDSDTPLKVTKPIRLIELFAGYGSQSLALKYLGIPFEHWKIAEWAIPSVQAYKDMHFIDDTDYSSGLSHDELVDYFTEHCISSDYNTPLTREQLQRRKDLRKIYNNAKASHNLLSVTAVHGEDLGITDTENYTYIMTYSFPCQDLSGAGLQKGMSRGSGTRSGMLWEVERILKEIVSDGGELPQILLMENVPDVCETKNIQDFNEWLRFLESIGYTNKYTVHNAKDFSIPQNRERCFCVSWLGDYYYNFPDKTGLEYSLIHFLDDEVDDKYYLSDDMIEKYLAFNKERALILEDIKLNQCGTLNYYGYEQIDRVYSSDGLSPTITASGREPKVEVKTDIRKFTEEECFRLMGVKKEDFERVRKNQSMTSLYHLPGDSIVTTCLMAIFGQMFEIDYEAKIKDLVKELIR